MLIFLIFYFCWGTNKIRDSPKSIRYKQTFLFLHIWCDFDICIILRRFTFHSFVVLIKYCYAALLIASYTHTHSVIYSLTQSYLYTHEHTYMFAYALCMLFSCVVVFVRALNALKCSHFVLQLALTHASAVAILWTICYLQAQ